jgi:hypothetical protein
MTSDGLGEFTFGSIESDGEAYEHEVVIDLERFTSARRKPRGNSSSFVSAIEQLGKEC